MIAKMRASVRANLSLPTLAELGKVFHLRRTTWNYVDDAYRREERKMTKSGSRTPQPPRHGVIKVSSMKPEHARRHLAAMTASMSEVHDYGSHGTGFSSEGSFASGGGAAGADYQTTSTGNTGDSDSMGPTGY
jgi:hypothetical protein